MRLEFCSQGHIISVISFFVVQHANSFGDYLATPVPVEVELTGLCKGAVVSIHGGFHDTALIDEEGKVILFGGENDGSGMHRSLPRVFEAVGDIRATQVVFGVCTNHNHT